jgi:hypothetical protein
MNQRLGRPFKPVTGKKRLPISLIVTADVKRKLVAAAHASGRSQSQEAELLIELALHCCQRKARRPL